MPTPGEHKTVQPRFLGYARVIGWTYALRAVAKNRRRLRGTAIQQLRLPNGSTAIGAQRVFLAA